MSAALVAAACGLAAQPPTLSVPLGTNAFGEYELLVYDDTGLVAGGQTATPTGAADPSGIHALPDTRELEIEWTGGACAHRPQLRVSGNSDALRLALSNPQEPQLPPVVCPAVGIYLAVTLTLKQPVTQQAVKLDVTN